MPLEDAKKVVANPNATTKEIQSCKSKIDRQIGHLSCRSNSDPQLLQDLLELEKIAEQLQEQYDAKSK